MGRPADAMKKRPAALAETGPAVSRLDSLRLELVVYSVVAQITHDLRSIRATK
jgi:hypothetical protein